MHIVILNKAVCEKTTSGRAYCSRWSRTKVIFAILELWLRRP